VAVRTCFQVLGEDRPLVLAVDDVQWVDRSSADALAFALRRLRGQRIRLLLARRIGERAEAPVLEENVGSDAVQKLSVGPLSIGAVHALLQRSFGRTFARPTLRRVYEVSGGNPFYALELARGLSAEGNEPMKPLRVPETLERLVDVRVAGFRGATRDALLLTAAHGRPSPALLHAAAVSPEALEPALAAHVVELSDGVTRFTHPLLASVLYQGATEGERKRAHRRLAAVVDDSIERARHLALASSVPDEKVAAALEYAAGRARARGTIVAAADLAEHALRLTPAGALADQHRRTIAAARAHLEAGEARRARVLALELLARTGSGADGRVEALVLLSDVERAGAHLERAIELRREALEAAAGLPGVQAELHQWLAGHVRVTEGAACGDRHAVAALELAETLDDDFLRAGALGALAFGRFRAGDPDAPRLIEESQQAASGLDEQMRRKVDFVAVHALVWSYQLDRAWTLLDSIDREWSERDERTSGDVLWWRGMIELRRGLLPLAADYAERSREISRQYAIDHVREPTNAGWLSALIAAQRGDLEVAREWADADLSLTEGVPVLHSGDVALLGLVDLMSGRPGEAAARFAAADEERSSDGLIEPAMFWWRADYAEALLGAGRPEEAAALVESWEAEAARLRRDAVLAELTRCRGLVAATRRDVETALVELTRAVEQHQAVGDSLGRARSLLALGIVRRQARQRRASREALTAALESFETSGAAGWAQKARAELGMIGGRSRVDGLTPAEGRIAALVADGHTNREVAAALFVTEQTVATALTRVYTKLGVRSRTELARRHVGEPRPAKT
jgi:DNA-binding CsgD family transcriptional regulator